MADITVGQLYEALTKEMILDPTSLTAAKAIADTAAVKLNCSGDNLVDLAGRKSLTVKNDDTGELVYGYSDSQLNFKLKPAESKTFYFRANVPISVWIKAVTGTVNASIEEVK